ncbi:hypothetical protein GGS26DRAFT_107427 [Hypomontagnella submonticulosa]|nr:hypothetical protein GGS26DRAFT_107427 [Hypomontagnella submonticulosa]
MDGPRRVIIRTRVTYIEGTPEERVKNFGQVFGSHVLERPLKAPKDGPPHDEMHFLPGCDSPDPVSAWFIYDLNYVGDVNKEELRKIPHDVYLASLVEGEWKFISRHNWVDGARERCLIYPWGGAKLSKMDGLKIPLGKR